MSLAPIFSLPTYFFIATFSVMIAYAIIQALTGTLETVVAAAGLAALRPARRRAGRRTGADHAVLFDGRVCIGLYRAHRRRGDFERRAGVPQTRSPPTRGRR